MKKAAIIPAMTLFSVMLASCDLFPDFSLKNPNDNLPDTLEEGFFYAQNITSRWFYTLEAEPLYEGDKCVIWAEKGSGVTDTDARAIAGEYDDNIRQKMVDAFSIDKFSGSYEGVTYDFDDILDYANWLIDKDDKDDRKLTILLLDIKDGYKTRADPYVAGYFYPGNFSPKGKIKDEHGNTLYCSNGRDMIYVDTNPGLKENPAQTFETFAHELQHLMNFATRTLLRKNSMDTWIDEGLSAYAEYLYLEKNPRDKCLWLDDDRNTIKTGNNFFVWDNYKTNPVAIMDDYATVYLFFRWLYLQADTGLQSHIFRDIMRSPHNDYLAVTSVAAQINPAWSDWGTLLRTWLAANYNPKNAVYGYRGDLYLQDGYGESHYQGIRVKPIGGSTRLLYPGEGVYSIINNPVNPAVSGNIRYAGLVAGNTSGIDLLPPYNGNILLTFNANTSNSKAESSEIGSLTGVSPSVSASRTAAEGAQPEKQTRPFVIDARDILGRDQDMPIRVSR